MRRLMLGQGGEAIWDGRSDLGAQVGSGVYMARTLEPPGRTGSVQFVWTH